MKIKSFIIAIICLSTSGFIQAQSSIKEFTVEGLKVYFRPTPKDVISVRLFVNGGTANYTLDQQGIESLALNVAMEGGTTSKNKVQFNTEAEKIGATFGASSSLDYSEMNLTCLKSYWDKSWALFADAVLNPAFDANEFDLVKQQMISAAKQREADPDAYLREQAMSFVFKGRGYERIPDGTASSLDKMTADAAKAYYKNLIGKGRAFLVVVGNLSEAEITAKVKASLAKLPAGSQAKANPRVAITDAKSNIVDRDIATNYLIGMMTAPQLNTPDGIPMMVAMNILYDKLFIEIRTKRGLSYAPSGSYNTTANTSPFSSIYASTDSPKSVITVMTNLLNDLKKNGFTEKELADKKQQFLTGYLMQLETSSSQSLTIGRWASRGNVKMFDEFTSRVNAVTLKDLNRVIDQNTNAIVWTYLGHKDEVKEADFKQPTVYQNKPY